MKRKKPEIPHDYDLRAAVGQMSIVSFPGNEWNPELELLFRRYHIGGVIFFKENIANRQKLKQLTAKIRKFGSENPYGVPPFITVDEEGGRVSRLSSLIGEHPSQKVLGSNGSEKAFKDSYSKMAEDIKKLGFNVTWAPVLDINTNVNNPVIGDRAFGDEAKTVVKYGKMALRAMRGAGLLTCAKHFPGHGDTLVDSHVALPVLKTTLRQLKSRELLPFKMAISEKVDLIMTAHIMFQKIDPHYPVTFSEKFLRKMLRKEMGFKGLVVSDDLNMGATEHHFSLKERITLALNAGVDLLLIRGENGGVMEFLDTFHSIVHDGLVPLERIEESIKRIKALKTRTLLKD